jgi:cation-transporting ATPase 13A3/4/5
MVFIFIVLFLSYLFFSLFLKEIWGYQRSDVATAISWFFIIISVGFLRLVFYWKPHWMLKATHVKCSLNQATTVLLKVQKFLFFG